MQFMPRKRRAAPSVIIVSLIDVLLGVLIFLMVTTTAKQQPALKLALPESKQKKSGSTENTLVVSIYKQAPIYLGKEPTTVDRLAAQLTEKMAQNPNLTLSIRADKEAPFGQIVKVMDAAKAANIKTIDAYTKSTEQ